MLVACWSVKGGSGTTVVAAATGLLLAASGHDVLVVDLAGDIPAALGIPQPGGPGVADWLAAGRDVEGDALARLEVEAGPHLAVVPAGRHLPDEPARAEQLAEALAADGRVSVVDCGSAPTNTSMAVASAAGLSLLVLRPCYLALRRALQAPADPSAVVLVGEPQRSLGKSDVEDVLGLEVRAAVPWRPAIATAVDAGLLGRRLPSPLERALRGLVETVAA